LIWFGWKWMVAWMQKQGGENVEDERRLLALFGRAVV
jgi:hypothetical protein